MQGAVKISQRRICMICKQEIFFRNAAVGMKCGFLEVPIISPGTILLFDPMFHFFLLKLAADGMYGHGAPCPYVRAK